MRSRSRTAWLVGLAAALAVGVWAPDIPMSILGPVSVAWPLLLLVLTVTALAALRRRVGWWAVGVVLLALGGGAFVLGRDWPASADPRVPCRRNWGWLPSYLPRPSPGRSLSFAIDGVRIRLCYGSPRLRGRRMIGAGPVPFGSLWRTGANEPTTIRSSAPILVAGIRVEGKASLYTVPGPETWELIVNEATAQWGLESQYTEEIRARELGRTILPAAPSDKLVESLRFTVGAGPAPRSRYLTLTWERSILRIPISVAPQ